MRWSGMILSIVAVVVSGTSASATGPISRNCNSVFPEPFAAGQPFVLKDPRTGLTLHLESDGRHMKAIARDGRVVWYRDLFSNPALEKEFLQPPPFQGKHSVSPKEWRRQQHVYLAQQKIDRLGIEPDCMVHFIDRNLPASFKGHYVRAGSGTHIFWLLEAQTGDFKMEEIN